MFPLISIILFLFPIHWNKWEQWYESGYEPENRAAVTNIKAATRGVL